MNKYILNFGKCGVCFTAQTETGRANAALIASAPDLLVSLENVLIELKRIHNLSPRDVGILDQVEQQIEYVIKKARGET